MSTANNAIQPQQASTGPTSAQVIARPIRPLPARNSAQSTSFSPAACADALDILRYFFTNTPPDEIHVLFVSALSAQIISPVDVRGLLAAMEALGVVKPLIRAAAEDEMQRHCVRCHQSYKERNNHGQVCVILNVQERIRIAKEVQYQAQQFHMQQMLKQVGANGNHPVDPVARQPVIISETRVLSLPSPALVVLLLKTNLAGFTIKPAMVSKAHCFLGRHTMRVENVEYNMHVGRCGEMCAGAQVRAAAA